MDVEDVLSFWFDGDLGAARTVWFEKDAGFDADCSGFGATRDAAKAGHSIIGQTRHAVPWR